MIKPTFAKWGYKLRLSTLLRCANTSIHEIFGNEGAGYCGKALLIGSCLDSYKKRHNWNPPASLVARIVQKLSPSIRRYVHTVPMENWLVHAFSTRLQPQNENNQDKTKTSSNTKTLATPVKAAPVKVAAHPKSSLSRPLLKMLDMDAKENQSPHRTRCKNRSNIKIILHTKDLRLRNDLICRFKLSDVPNLPKTFKR